MRSGRIPTLAALLAVAVALGATAWPMATRAYFVFDDYRFLAELRRVDRGEPGAFRDALVIENRWDNHWWIEDGTSVRFFRPFNLASYGLDRALFGESARGFIATNIALHLAASAVVFLLLRRLFERAPGAPFRDADGGLRERAAVLAALVGAVAFATQACHVEHVRYVAARQGTMAGLFFFGALAVFLGARAASGWGRWGMIAALYFCALAAKESAAILPLFFLLADRWLPPPNEEGPGRRLLVLLRRRWQLYAASAVALVGYLILRAAVLGAEGGGVHPYPYFHLPGRAGAMSHAVALAGEYVTALVSGHHTAPFVTDLAQAWERNRLWLVASPIAFAGVLWCSRRSAPARFGLTLLVLPLVPMLFVYGSTRYLYIPSLGYCIIVGVVAARAAARSRSLAMLWTAVAVGLPAGMHVAFLIAVPASATSPTHSQHIVRGLDQSPLDLSGDRPVFLLDFHMDWIAVQFLPQTAEIVLDHPVPPISVLTRIPADGVDRPVELTRIDRHTVRLSRDGRPLLLPDAPDFDPRTVSVGERIRESGYELEIIEAIEGRPTTVQIRFDLPLEQLQFARFVRIREGVWRIEVS